MIFSPGAYEALSVVTVTLLGVAVPTRTLTPTDLMVDAASVDALPNTIEAVPAFTPVTITLYPVVAENVVVAFETVATVVSLENAQ